MNLQDPEHWAKADRCLALDGLAPRERMLLRTIRALRSIEEPALRWLNELAERNGTN